MTSRGGSPLLENKVVLVSGGTQGVGEVVTGEQPSPCTVVDGLVASWIAEACTRSRLEHRPVRLSEVR